MKQEYTSAKTSINHLPALFKYVKTHHGWNYHPTEFSDNLDIGAGKFPQNMTTALKQERVCNWAYDPYNLPADTNDGSLRFALRWKVDTVTISNVLCVIKESDARCEVLKLAKKVLKPGGKVFISIYTGNGSGQPAPTRAGWQNNKPLEWYLPEIEQYFKILHKTKKFITGEPLT